jgi:N-methylhydantoinase A
MPIGVDVGGTFTDLVRWDGRTITTAKLPTALDQSAAVATSVRSLAGDRSGQLLLHGTTVATNALLERKGARTVLVTDAGFEDLIEIGRQDRPSLYDSMVDRPPSLVDRADRIGWRTEADLSEVLASLHPQAVAVALLNAFVDGAAEVDLGSIISEILPGIPVSLSHRVNGEFREYERFATTVLNAYLQPVVTGYLSALTASLIQTVSRVLVMRSSGGLTSAEGGAELAAALLLSGPAGGVVAAAACGSSHGWNRIISFDMGGTSTDVCRIENGQPEVGSGLSYDGVVCRLPSVAVHTIGAGGGSIGWRDQGGALRAGPRSAGAWPGPAAYGRGGDQPTVTDANLLAGRLGAERPLAGHTSLDLVLASSALQRLAATFGMVMTEAADGILEVIDAHMERAIRRVSIEQGADPRQAPLLAFGGAGALHATGLARRLDMPAVLVPPHAGVFSALGLLLSPVRHDLVKTTVMNDGDPQLDQTIGSLTHQAASDFMATIGHPATTTSVTVDVRYPGQSHETAVDYERGLGWDQLRSRFHVAHSRRNGFARPEDQIELVTIRVAATSEPQLSWSDLPGPAPTGEPLLGERSLPNGSWAQRVWRPALEAGFEIAGPAVIEEESATTWLGVGERARVLDDGTIEIVW